MSGDYEFEPVPGLPEELPPGEMLLWQGAPDWKTIATQFESGEGEVPRPNGIKVPRATVPVD